MDLHGRLSTFIDSLSTYPPGQNPDAPVADAFNALLELVKAEHGDDPIVAAISPARKSVGGASMVDAGSLVVAARQLLGAVPKPASSRRPLVA